MARLNFQSRSLALLSTALFAVAKALHATLDAIALWPLMNWGLTVPTTTVVGVLIGGTVEGGGGWGGGSGRESLFERFR